MKTNNWVKKVLALMITTLFLGIGTTTSTGDIEIEKYTDLETSNYKESTLSDPPEDLCYPELIGTLGENGWFISDVSIIFWHGPMVIEIWYNIEGDWVNYTGLFTFTKEGDFSLNYKWKLIHGEWRNSSTATHVKIDKTPPTITLNKKVGLLDKKKITYTANVDIGKGSPIEKVEFLVDGELYEILKEPDYKVVYENIGRTQEVEVIVYDEAGYSASDTSDTTSASHPTLFMSKILQRIHFLSQLLLKLIIKIIVPSC